MDNFETSSNSSTHSDRCDSLSTISGYEDELLEIKSLISSPPNFFSIRSSQPTGKKSVNVYEYENKIKVLNTELESSQKLNDQLKKDILEQQRKYELEHHKKFEKLLSTNKDLQQRLKLTQEHVKTLEESFNKEEANGQIKYLEKSNYELNLQLNQQNNELNTWKKIANEYESENRQLKIQLEEEKCLLDAKSNATNALKKVVSELHIQMQNLLQAKIKATNDLTIKNNEIDALNNSKNWFEKQLHLTRDEKNKILQENIKLNAMFVAKCNEIKSITEEFNNYKSHNEEMIAILIKEKEKLQGQLENLKRNIKETEDKPKTNSDDNLHQHFELTLKNYLDIIMDLQREVNSVKQEISSQEIHNDSVKKQNAELLSINTVLQKKLNEKEYDNENLRLEIKKLENNYESFKTQKIMKESLITELTEKNVQLQTKLKILSDEKEEIESVTDSIRENFNKLLNKFNEIKVQLNIKDQTISKMREENHKLFMNENWQKTELEKLQIDNKKIDDLEENMNKLKFNDQSLQQENIRLNKLVSELQKRIENLNAEQVSLLRNVSVLEERNKNLTEECENEKKIYFSKTNVLNNEIEILNNEVGNLENLIANFKTEKEELQKEKEIFAKTVTDLQKTVEKFKTEQQYCESNNCENDRNKKGLQLFQKNQLLPWMGVDKKDLENNGFIQASDSKMNSEALEQITTLIKYVLNGEDIMEPLHSISTKVVETNKYLKSVVDSIVSIHNMKSHLVNKNAKYEKFILSLKEMLLTGLQEADEKYIFLQERQKKLENKIRSISDLFKNFEKYLKGSNKNENSVSEKGIQEIENLSILVQAKEMEIKEKQKRYEINYRTLLRKVKEHMRGRKMAEKNCEYLKEIYNNVFEELNTLKLESMSNEYKLQNAKNDCENYKATTDKLEFKIIELQNEIYQNSKYCEKCSNYEELFHQKENSLKILNNILKEKENQLKTFKDLNLEVKELSLEKEKFEKELQNEKVKNEKLQLEIIDKNKNITFLDESLTSIRVVCADLTNKLKKEQEHQTLTLKEKENAVQKLTCQEEENAILSDKINMMSCNLNQAEEQICLLQTQKNDHENMWNKRESDLRNLINLLRNETVFLKNELQIVRNELKLCQSYCTELRAALDLTVKQNKKLKDQIQQHSEESLILNNNNNQISLIREDLPAKNKWDENLVNELLQKINSPLPNPFPELHNSLASLKDEILGLKEQIIQKE